MSFDEIMKNQEVLSMLHEVLEARKTKKKISVFSPNGEMYGYNQYSLFIVIDSLIKYKIVIDQVSFFPTYLRELQKICRGYQDHKELVVCCNELLGEMIRLVLGLDEKYSKESKRAILEHLYDKYIVHGFLFHSFPSCYKKGVEETGIDPNDYRYPMNEIKRIKHIFKNHKYDDILPKDFLERTPNITLTDSPAMAYYYAVSSPMYFSSFTSTGKYMKKDELYDREAYYRRDFLACKKNIETLCNHIDMTGKEQAGILSAFEKQWNMLGAKDAVPCIAFIDRKEVEKDKLNDIDDILKRCEKEELVISIARITDSRYAKIKRYRPLSPLSFFVRTLPSYKQIKNNILEQEMEKPLIEKTVLNPLLEEQLPKKKEYKGYASIVASFGLLLISLGLTLIIIYRVFGIGGR